MVALLISSIAGAALVVRLGSEPPAQRELAWDLGDNARKMVTIAGGLAAFTITGVVLLLSFAREPGRIGTPLASAVGMFLVSFMSLVASAIMYANQTRPEVVRSGVDVQLFQYSITTMLFFRSVFLGWLALVPLVEAYGLDELAEQVRWLVLVLAVVAGWTTSVAVLHRLSLVRTRVVVLVPVLALVGCAVAATMFRFGFIDARSTASPLYLTYALFGVNALSFLVFAVIPPALEHQRFGPLIARSWGPSMAVIGLFSAMTIGFIWLATAGLL